VSETAPPTVAPDGASADGAIGAKPLWAVARVLLKGAALLTLTLASMLGVFLLVPESNDYARASLRKHERLARYEAPKIVLVGGSNLAFGIDSAMISRAIGCPVVNMGMNGYLGVRYMLEEVKRELNPSDLVVLAFEYDNFYKTVDGRPTDILVVVKANPTAFTYLSFDQQMDVLGSIPFATQQKVLRLLEEATVWAKDGLMGRAAPEADETTISAIETASGFTPEGDLISHLGVAWSEELEDGIIPPDGAIDPQVIGLMQAFGAQMQARGVDVMVSYTPITRAFYEQHAATLNEVHARIGRSPPLNTPSTPEAFAYDESFFFDTVYHLNAEGRELRTQRLIEDMERHLQGDSMCTQTAHAGE